jgi:hypothetical protein
MRRWTTAPAGVGVEARCHRHLPNPASRSRNCYNEPLLGSNEWQACTPALARGDWLPRAPTRGREDQLAVRPQPPPAAELIEDAVDSLRAATDAFNTEEGLETHAYRSASQGGGDRESNRSRRTVQSVARALSSSPCGHLPHARGSCVLIRTHLGKRPSARKPHARICGAKLNGLPDHPPRECPGGSASAVASLLDRDRRFGRHSVRGNVRSSRLPQSRPRRLLTSGAQCLQRDVLVHVGFPLNTRPSAVDGPGSARFQRMSMERGFRCRP